MLMADSGATAGLRYVDPPTNRNLVINGAMQVAQRGTSVTGITNDAYRTADRWSTLINIGTWTQSIETDGPSGSGFAKSLKMLCTTANGSPSASGRNIFTQSLEGQDVQRVRKGTSAAQQLTLSFWVKSNVTGTYVAELQDANSRQVSATYSVSAANTWESKTITFPADASGVIANDNAAGLSVLFWLAAGSNFTSGTLNTAWASTTNANRTVGQTNLAAATNNYWQVTGVQLETGPVATPFEFEPVEATLRKCQRYYYLHAEGSDKTLGVAAYYSDAYLIGAVQFPITMRTAPTLSATSGTNYYRADRNNGQDDFNSLSLVLAHENQGTIINNTEVSGTGGHAASIKTFNASTRVAFSAEL
jgi:hypothetical protein